MSQSASTVSFNQRPQVQKSANSPASISSLSDSVFNGFTISLLEAPWWIAMLALVFSGPLADHLGQAAIYLMIGACISMTITSFFSSWKGAIWLPQDVPTAILVVISTQLLSSVATDISTESLFVTMVVTIALASMLTGVFMYALGTMRMGKLVRYIPFPVLAGFLGGTGCLLIIGGIDNSLGPQAVDDLFAITNIIQWLPCILLALAIYWLGLRIKHAILIPLMMLGATVNFFLIAWLLGVPMETLQADGWLFGLIPTADTHSVLLTHEQIQSVQWQAIFAQSGNLITLALASALAMLLNNSGFALTVKQSFNHNNDLRTAGIANLFAGLVGGWPGYISPAWSAINARQGRQLPLTGLIVALVTGLLLWYATQLLSYAPRFVIGSAVAYVGVSFLFEWVLIPAKRLSRIEYSTLLLVTGAAVTFGLIEAVVFGLCLTGLLKLTLGKSEKQSRTAI